MIHHSRIALSVLIAAALVACGSKPDPEPAPVAAAPEATEEEAPAEQVATTESLRNACSLDMSEPDSREWQTQWDPTFSRNITEHPSGVRSAHWLGEQERQDGVPQIPFELSCGSGAGSDNPITIDLIAADSSLTDIPMSYGEYPITLRSNTGKNNPGEFIVAGLQYGSATFEARGGRLIISRFDAEGAAGSFEIEGKEIGGEGRDLRVEGTFDMPCRRARMQYGCQSNAAEQE